MIPRYRLTNGSQVVDTELDHPYAGPLFVKYADVEALVASEQQTKNALAAERARVHALEQERDAPEQPVYYAEALNLVCDELLKLAPSDYEARRDKIVAIIRNAAVAVRRCDNELTAERARIVGLRQS